MLAKKDLVLLKQNLESERVEFKPSTSQSSAIRRAICAFANDLAGHGKPGVIFVGLHDDGTCAGLEITDEVQRRLSDWAFGGDILPRPDVEVYAAEVDDCHVAVVEVHPAAQPPVRYRGQVWVRIGTTNRGATPEQEHRLAERRRSADLPFDHRPVEDAATDALDLDFFEKQYLPNAISPEILEQNQRDINQKLASLRFLTSGRPNYGSLLIFGRDPRQRIPGAYLQFLRIDGDRMGDPIKDEKMLSGPLPEIMDRVDQLLEVHIQVSVDIESASRDKKKPDYPASALQQLIRNALIHRSFEGTHAPVRVYWFSGRIEISNPGGLYGQVTEANFGQGATDYRNPLIAEAMRVLGYIQRFGYGIPLARRRLQDNGNPSPDFQFESTQTAVTVEAAQ
jgi:ATP-dependent DNA helicase RecG